MRRPRFDQDTVELATWKESLSSFNLTLKLFFSSIRPHVSNILHHPCKIFVETKSAMRISLKIEVLPKIALHFPMVSIPTAEFVPGIQVGCPQVSLLRGTRLHHPGLHQHQRPSGLGGRGGGRGGTVAPGAPAGRVRGAV